VCDGGYNGPLQHDGRRLVADERVMVMARRVAPLLPEPPAAYDAFGYLAWEELVLTTARRLAPYLSAAVVDSPIRLPALRFSPASGRLDAESVATLAVLLARDVDSASCESLLLDALDARRCGTDAPTPAFMPQR
jgi:hypothetical protein